MLVLDETNTAAYLLERGLIQGREGIRTRVLSGGVSNQVIKVITPSQNLVLKQARPRLRVELEWLADIERIFAEYACLQLLQRILPPGSVPQPLFLDPENYVYAMECAPEGSLNWKTELLQGRLHPEVADEAGRLLAQMHRQTATDPSAQETFSDQRVFFQLRVDPYYRTMVARRHPDLHGPVDDLIREMGQHREALVHGDYSPKNILIHQGRAILLDFEVVHWGDPAFDIAFLAHHLVLKSLHRPHEAHRYHEAIRRFWSAYRTARQSPGSGEPGRDSRQEHLLEEPYLLSLQRRSLRHVACLMLARIDGKSPVDYLSGPNRERARSLSRDLILNPATEWDDLLERIARGAGEA